MSFEGQPLLWMLLLNALLVAVLMFGTWVAAQRTGHWSVVDITWGLGFAAIAAVSFLFSLATANADTSGWPIAYRWLLLALVWLWAGRLAWHIASRARGKGEDPRYVAMKQRHRSMFTVVLLPQGVAMWLVSLPIQVAFAFNLDRSASWTVPVGVGLWLVGVLFEAVGDAQLKRFKSDPSNSGKIIDTGLWSRTRHPNYFGDACVWWGLWLLAADVGWPGWATVGAPLAMTIVLVYGTGARLLEKNMMLRPGYREYAERTPVFFPRIFSAR